MLDWSDYFYWKLLESQKNFAQSMNHKTEWKFFKLLKAWQVKNTQPRYQEIALHKVLEEEFKIEIPKSTISTWLDRVPQLLEQKEELKNMLDEYFKSSAPVKKKEEIKYTRAEWEQLHKLEWYQLNIEYKAMMAKLNNPNLTDTELMKLTWASQRLINKINNYWVTMTDTDLQKRFIEINEKIMQVWNERLLREIQNMPAFSMKDLKALSGIVDDVFKQHRLLTGQSTENIAHWVDDIYEAILQKAEAFKLNSWNSDQNKETIIEAEIIKEDK